MSTKLTKEQREEALAKVAEVLEEAMAEYEMLEKMDLELAEDPTRPMAEAQPEEEEEQDDEEREEDDKDEDEEEDEKEEDEEPSDEALKSEYAALTAKMDARGLLKKEEPKAEKTEEVKKSEEAAPAPAPAAEDKTEALKKSIDERFEGLQKAIETIAATVEKIAAQPAPRKGVAGYQPLKKSEEGEEQQLNKTEVVNKLLELKKSGKQIPTELFARIETNRMTESDAKFIKGILG